MSQQDVSLAIASPRLTVPASHGLSPVRSGSLFTTWTPPAVEQERPARILIVDKEPVNRLLLKGLLKSSPYEIRECSRAAAALELLEREPIDLIIVDVMMPEISGPEFCRRVKSDRRTRLIPVLMLTSVRGTETEVESIESGADEFLTKPLQATIVRARIRAMLRNKAAIDSLEEAETILFALAQAVECRDRYTARHCQRLASYSVAIGKALGLPQDDLIALYRGGYLHDIGKISVPDSILHGTERLTAAEWEVMKQHTVRGEEICRPMRSLAPVLPIIRNHHERWDGTGYPDGLKGEDIPLVARILQIADIYDALTTERSYKPAFSHHEAIRMMEEEVQKGWRDPELICLFVSLTNGYLQGAPLNDEVYDLLAEADPTRPMRQSLTHLRNSLDLEQANPPAA